MENYAFECQFHEEGQVLIDVYGKTYCWSVYGFGQPVIKAPIFDFIARKGKTVSGTFISLEYRAGQELVRVLHLSTGLNGPTVERYF